MQQVYGKEVLDGLDYCEKAKNSISAYCTPLIKPGKYPLKDMEIGSGTFVIIGNKRGILTNRHVAQIFYPIGSPIIGVPHVNEGLQYLAFSLVVKWDASENLDLIDPDLAFIELDDKSCDVVTNDLKKKFWAFNPDFLNIDYNSKNCMWIIWGNVYEGRRNSKDPKLARPYSYFPNTGLYIVVPDLDNIRYEKYNLGIQDITIMLDVIDCPIQTIEKVPSKFKGMSGAALWQIIFNEDGSIQSIFLAGIATAYTPHKKAEKLICRGPIALSFFFSFVRNHYTLSQI